MDIIGRDSEIAEFLALIKDARPWSGPYLLCVAGPEDIGKSHLLKAFCEKAHSVNGSAFFSLDTSVWSTLDPFSQMLRLRRNARRRWPDLDTDGFDALAALFDLKFRDGLLAAEELRGAAFDPGQLAEEMMNDALKTGGESVLGEFRRAGLAPFVAGAASGAVVLRDSAVDMILAGAASITAVGLILITKMVILGVLKRHRLCKAARRDPELNDLFAICERASHTDFMNLMPKLLGRSLARHVEHGPSAAPCIAIDPADAFGHPDNDHPARRLGETLGIMIAQMPRSITVLTTVTPFEQWKSEAGAFASRFRVQRELPLASLPREVAVGWLTNKGISPAIAREALAAEGETISYGSLRALLRQFASASKGPSGGYRDSFVADRNVETTRGTPFTRRKAIMDAFWSFDRVARSPELSFRGLEDIERSLNTLSRLGGRWTADERLRYCLVVARRQKRPYTFALEHLFAEHNVHLRRPRKAFIAATAQLRPVVAGLT